MRVKVSLDRTELVSRFGPEEVDVADNAGLLNVVSENHITFNITDEIINNPSPQGKRLLRELAKHPSRTFGECLIIYLNLVNIGLTQEASSIMKKTQEEQKAQLLSLANQHFGQKIFNV